VAVTRLLSSLSNRIFLAATLLAWLSIAAALLFVNVRLARESERALERRLAETTSLVQQQQQALVDTFTRMARLVADLPKLKAAMATGDAPTVAPIAAQYLTDLAADLLVVTDADGTVLAKAGTAGTGLDGATVRQLGALPAGTRLRPHPRGALQMVTVPVQLGFESPERLGALSVGFLLDDRRAAQIGRITGVDLAFAVDGRVLASTLAPATSAGWPTALDDRGSGRVWIGATEYAWRSQALADPENGGATAGKDPIVIVLEPTAPSAATLRAVRVALGGIALATAALAVAVSYAVARTVTRPLATITDAMREMAATGDLTRRIAVHDRGPWHDEDTRLLATTFNALTESIGNFQRESRERERLSALGRLSTVIAHEIRNPLMIMRGALRQLTRPTSTRSDIREAASDIEGEVQRLDRVVDDVLDFARPVQLDLAPTDINAVCVEAAGAVKAARPDADIRLSPAPDDPVIACDGDRLRTVLVNVLTNAYQAMQAAHDGTPVVVMTVHRGEADGRVCITVCDTGQGIAADDLPHVFEPYFTTRRTGTGLGLPIAHAIVVGLGGSIGMQSMSGQGTTVTIELGGERTR
jgi:signal transduction histidine kinase